MRWNRKCECMILCALTWCNETETCFFSFETFLWNTHFSFLLWSNMITTVSNSKFQHEKRRKTICCWKKTRKIYSNYECGTCNWWSQPHKLNQPKPMDANGKSEKPTEINKFHWNHFIGDITPWIQRICSHNHYAEFDLLHSKCVETTHKFCNARHSNSSHFISCVLFICFLLSFGEKYLQNRNWIQINIEIKYQRTISFQVRIE